MVVGAPVLRSAGGSAGDLASEWSADWPPTPRAGAGHRARPRGNLQVDDGRGAPLQMSTGGPIFDIELSSLPIRRSASPRPVLTNGQEPGARGTAGAHQGHGRGRTTGGRRHGDDGRASSDHELAARSTRACHQAVHRVAPVTQQVVRLWRRRIHPHQEPTVSDAGRDWVDSGQPIAADGRQVGHLIVQPLMAEPGQVRRYCSNSRQVIRLVVPDPRPAGGRHDHNPGNTRSSAYATSPAAFIWSSSSRTNSSLFQQSKATRASRIRSVRTTPCCLAASGIAWCRRLTSIFHEGFDPL